MLIYPSGIDLSSSMLRRTRLMHRRAIGGSWRCLIPGRQALLVLAHLLRGDTYAQLAAGFRVGIANRRRQALLLREHKRHGMNLQVLADPLGRLTWAAPARRGARSHLCHPKIRAVSEQANAPSRTGACYASRAAQPPQSHPSRRPCSAFT